MKKVLKVIGGICVVVVVIGVVIFLVSSATSNKLVCKSNEGNITIMYNEKELTGYTAKGMTYEYDSQKEIANNTGVEQYLSQFSIWFSDNTTGSCVKEVK